MKIDPEFRDKIPPLTGAEFEQLKENILADGEVYEPIAVWNGTIVDGHNRWKVIQEHPEKLKDRFRIKEMDFPDKWVAFEWMYKKQLGRRNLTDEQKTYMIGKMYEARKNTDQFKGNQYTKKSGDGQNVHNQNRREQRDGTAGQIGKETGVDGRTVRRAEKFSKGIDALREESVKAAEKVLSGKSTANKENVIGFVGMPQEKKQEFVSAILNDKPTPKAKETRYKKKPESPERIEPQTVPPASSYNGGGTKQYREERKQIAAIVADMYDPSTVPEYTVSDMVDEIKLNAENYISIVRNVLADRSSILTDENRPTVAAALDEVIEQMKKIRKLVSDESVSERP